MEGRAQRPTAAEVIAKLKDDGDFDNLRLKITRKVKENEELRNSIVTEVKQSAILNQDGSENLKPKQLSDAIYQELGKKIMGQISDEVWKVIRSNDNIKDDIRGTMESVYNRILNPKGKDEDHHSSPSKENPISGKGNSVSPGTASIVEANMCDESEPKEPPGFAPCDQQASEGNEVEHKELLHDQHLSLPSEEELHCPPNTVQPNDDMPPGFGTSGVGDGASIVPPGFDTCGGGGAMPPSIDASVGGGGGGGGGSSIVLPIIDTSGGGGGVVPPGFRTCGGDAAIDTGGDVGTMPPGFGTSNGGGDEDDPDVPPGFG